MEHIGSYVNLKKRVGFAMGGFPKEGDEQRWWKSRDVRACTVAFQRLTKTQGAQE